MLFEVLDKLKQQTIISKIILVGAVMVWDFIAGDKIGGVILFAAGAGIVRLILVWPIRKA